MSDPTVVLVRLARRDLTSTMHSALPDAPVVAHTSRPRRAPRTRTATATALRRMAHRLAPA